MASSLMNLHMPIPGPALLPAMNGKGSRRGGGHFSLISTTAQQTRDSAGSHNHTLRTCLYIIPTSTASSTVLSTKGAGPCLLSAAEGEGQGQVLSSGDPKQTVLPAEERELSLPFSCHCTADKLLGQLSYGPVNRRATLLLS